VSATLKVALARLRGQVGPQLFDDLFAVEALAAVGQQQLEDLARLSRGATPGP
jgi:hypothetical protein